MSQTHWKIIIPLLVVLSVAIVLGLGFGALLPFRGGFYPGMMGGYRTMMLPGFGLIGMLLMIVAPVGLLALIALAIIWLVQITTRPAPTAPIAAMRTCAHCGKPAQADWKTCPYCGTALAG